MKKITLIVANNGWEYNSIVKLTYKDSYKTERVSEYAKDSMGDPAPDKIILDGEYEIEFDEGFELFCE